MNAGNTNLSADQTVVRLGLIQHACPPSNSTQQNRQRAADMIRDAANQGAQLVATQELFDAPYFPQEENEAGFEFAEPIPGPRTDFLGNLAKELGIYLTGSCFERRAAGLYHNTSVMIDPAGKIISRYRKMHIPDDPGFYEKFYFTPGDADGWPTQDLQLSGTEKNAAAVRTGMLTCWDQWYPEAARIMALQGAQILCYPTAIAWHADETDDEKKRQHDAWITVQRSHAITNATFVCAINRTGTERDLTFWGSSFIAAPGGDILAQAPVDSDAVLVADCDLSLIEKNRQGWPFLRDRRIDAYAGLLERFIDDA